MNNFIEHTFKRLAQQLMHSPPIHRGTWQSIDVSQSAMHETFEMTHVTVDYEIPATVKELAADIQPNLPWADEHFAERVSGIPHNPPPSHVNWPYARSGNIDHTRCPTCNSRQPSMHPAVSGEGEVTRLCPDPFHSGQPGQFSHTYPERFWPRYRTDTWAVPSDFWNDHRVVITSDGYELYNRHNDLLFNGTQEQYAVYLRDKFGASHPTRKGIRYRYGDLSDVVDLLVRNPLTRQAYLPVWFPEDTGATSGQRVPCTLGYHFLVTHGKIDIVYSIRSCDLLRHFQDDVYLAARLCQWMCEQYMERTEIATPEVYPTLSFTDLRPGRLIMHISSLHAFVGDGRKLQGMTKPRECLGCGKPTASYDRRICANCADIP